MMRFLFAPRFSLVTMIGAAMLSLGLASGSISSVLIGAFIALLGAGQSRRRRNGDDPWA